MTDIKISLLIPGYLSPSRSENHAMGMEITQCPVAMDWENDLPQTPWQAALFQELTQIEETGQALPAAELLSPGSIDEDFLVRADPVHLQADRDTAKLLPVQMLDLTEDDADAMLLDINQFLSTDGFKVFRGPDQGWYMSGMDATTLKSFPPSFLANRNASAYLPAGENSEQWRRLMTEIQMLLHTHPINEQRMRSGRLPINSLWFWGGAKMNRMLTDEQERRPTGLSVYADDDFSSALCAHLDVPCFSLENFDPTQTGTALIVDTRIASAHFSRDEAGLNQATKRVNVEWLAALIDRVRVGQITQINLMNEDGDCGKLTSASLKAHDRSGSLWGRVVAKLLGRASRA